MSEADEANRLTTVFSAPDDIVAEIVRGALEAEGIRAVIGQRLTQAYAPLLSLAEGYWCTVCVAYRDAERARMLIADFQEGRRGFTAEELEEAAERMSPPENVGDD